MGGKCLYIATLCWAKSRKKGPFLIPLLEGMYAKLNLVPALFYFIFITIFFNKKKEMRGRGDGNGLRQLQCRNPILWNSATISGSKVRPSTSLTVRPAQSPETVPGKVKSMAERNKKNAKLCNCVEAIEKLIENNKYGKLQSFFLSFFPFSLSLSFLYHLCGILFLIL